MTDSALLISQFFVGSYDHNSTAAHEQYLSPTLGAIASIAACMAVKDSMHGSQSMDLRSEWRLEAVRAGAATQCGIVRSHGVLPIQDRLVRGAVLRLSLIHI